MLVLVGSRFETSSRSHLRATKAESYNMASEAAIEQKLKGLGVTKSMMPDIIEAWKSDGRTLAARAKARLASNRRSMSKLAVSSLVVTAGGAIAEPVRRQLVGRFTKGIRGQALGMVLTGIAVDGVGGAYAGIPYAREVGDAHKAVGGWLLSVSMYGDDKAKDAVVIAIEGTTSKAKKDAKEKKNPEDK